jgi:hypothetical protein
VEDSLAFALKKLAACAFQVTVSISKRPVTH